MFSFYKKCVIVQISEGLGNQMFCYASARGLALKNDVPLYLDIHSQYRINHYKRQYLLDNYHIDGINIGKTSSFIGNIGHLLWKSKAFKKKFNIFYFEQKNLLDSDLLSKKIKGALYLFGYWQHEEYFKDQATQIRADFKRKTDPSDESKSMAKKIQSVNAVSIHVRTYREVDGVQRMSRAYFDNAIAYIIKTIPDPVFFIFSDDHEWVAANLHISGETIPVACNKDKGYVGAMDDLWLMNQCNHHILSSSSFSWWGAWLANKEDGVVTLPENSEIVRNGSFLKEWILL